MRNFSGRAKRFFVHFFAVAARILRETVLAVVVRECLHEKTRTGASFIPVWLFDFVSLLHDDWVISYLVIWRYFMLIKYTCDSKSQTLCIRYPFQSTCRPISHRNGWSFRVYMIPLRDFVPEWNSRPGTTTGVNSRRGWLAPAWNFVVLSCKKI